MVDGGAKSLAFGWDQGMRATRSSAAARELDDECVTFHGAAQSVPMGSPCQWDLSVCKVLHNPCQYRLLHGSCSCSNHDCCELKCLLADHGGMRDRVRGHLQQIQTWFEMCWHRCGCGVGS